MQTIIGQATELQELIWALIGARGEYGLEELRPYATLLDAIVGTANACQLPFDLIDVTVEGQYPLVVKWERDGPCQCLIELSAQGYRLVLYGPQDDHTRLYWEEWLVEQVVSLEAVVKKLSERLRV